MCSGFVSCGFWSLTSVGSIARSSCISFPPSLVCRCGVSHVCSLQCKQVSLAASSSSSQIPPPPPPPPTTLPDQLPLVPVQEEPGEWPQFDYHTEKRYGRKWVAFREEDQALLRAAWLAGQMTLMLDVDGYEYDIDLTPHQESQVARHSGFRRRVRVRHEAD